jgi:hypothetical protein
MSTYASLTQDIQDFAENDDTEFTTEIDGFILRAEERIFRETPFLPVFRAENTGTLTASTSTLTMPSGKRTIRSFSITVSSSEVFLQQRLDSYLKDVYSNAATEGQPKYYAEKDDTTLLVGPTPDSNYSYTIWAHEQPTGLSSGNTTTWLSSNVEDVLLFAAMVEATAFLKHPEAAAEWTARYAQALQSLQNEMGRNLGNENTVGA